MIHNSWVIHVYNFKYIKKNFITTILFSRLNARICIPLIFFDSKQNGNQKSLFSRFLELSMKYVLHISVFAVRKKLLYSLFDLQFLKVEWTQVISRFFEKKKFQCNRLLHLNTQRSNIQIKCNFSDPPNSTRYLLHFVKEISTVS